MTSRIHLAGIALGAVAIVAVSVAVVRGPLPPSAAVNGNLVRPAVGSPPGHGFDPSAAIQPMSAAAHLDVSAGHGHPEDDAGMAHAAAPVAAEAPFDRFLMGDRDAISAAQKHGYDLFLSLGCAACHQGRNVGGNMFQRVGIFANPFADRGAETTADLGRFSITGDVEDRYVFRVAPLRNVALTAPYFHDSSAATLEQAITFMARYQLGRTVAADDMHDIVAFLHSLSIGPAQ